MTTIFVQLRRTKCQFWIVDLANKCNALNEIFAIVIFLSFCRQGLVKKSVLTFWLEFKNILPASISRKILQYCKQFFRKGKNNIFQCYDTLSKFLDLIKIMVCFWYCNSSILYLLVVCKDKYYYYLLNYELCYSRNYDPKNVVILLRLVHQFDRSTELAA